MLTDNTRLTRLQDIRYAIDHYLQLSCNHVVQMINWSLLGPDLLMLSLRQTEAGEADCQHVGEDRLELLGDGAVDEEVGGEVDHDQQVGHTLQAHYPHGWDVLVQNLHTGHLHI